MTALLGDGRLGPDQRAEALRRMERERFDIVMIGGGVVGCGAALDAASRGLSVALVEARDYAAGTSSRSSRLLHGGLRYLEQAQLPLVREALRERDLMLQRLCPHLARPVPFLIPLERPGTDRAYLGAGVALYDLLARSQAVPRHRHLTRRGAPLGAGAAPRRPGRGHPDPRRPGRRRAPYDGIYFVPALTGLGSPYWDPHARGTIVGLTRGAGRAHLARAALEAIAYQAVDAIRVMERAGGEPLVELRADGGATVNRWLMQFQADVLGVPVVVPAVPETTALGAALLAGVGASSSRSTRCERCATRRPAMSRR